MTFWNILLVVLGTIYIIGALVTFIALALDDGRYKRAGVVMWLGMVVFALGWPIVWIIALYASRPGKDTADGYDDLSTPPARWSQHGGA